MFISAGELDAIHRRIDALSQEVSELRAESAVYTTPPQYHEAERVPVGEAVRMLAKLAGVEFDVKPWTDPFVIKKVK